MKKFGIAFLGILFLASAAMANCVDEGYSIVGSDESDEKPFGYEDYDCESCLRNGIYYWRCKKQEAKDVAETEAESEPKAEVNCMDYLRAGDVDGFAKCSGLPGKWEKKGNQLLRVE